MLEDFDFAAPLDDGTWLRLSATMTWRNRLAQRKPRMCKLCGFFRYVDTR